MSYLGIVLYNKPLLKRCQDGFKAILIIIKRKKKGERDEATEKPLINPWF